MRFRSTTVGKEGWRSLDEYITSFVPGQKQIYYIAGESFEALADSPFLERFKARGIEVLFLTDPIDEYAVQNLPEYENHRLQSITKEGLTLPGDEKSAKKREEHWKTAYEPLTRYLKKVYGEKVRDSSPQTCRGLVRIAPARL
jgi:HSP90 family molecular chaperone